MEENNKFINIWLEYINLLSTITPIVPSFGILQTYKRKLLEINKELNLLYNSILEFNKYLPKYNEYIYTTWFEATRKALIKCEENKISNKEEIKKVWIDCLEEEFTKLFNSDEFGELSGKLLNSENEINIHLSKLAEVYSNMWNIPTRKELDDIYKEITKLKRDIKKLADKLNTLKLIAKKEG